MSTKKPNKISGLRLVKWFVLLLREPLRSLQKVVATKGKVVEFNGGKYQKLYFVSDPEYVKHILKTNKDNFKRSPVIKALQPLLGNGIFISEDQTWQEQRNLLKPAFHDKVIQQFEDIILQECDRLILDWKYSEQSIDIEKDIEKLMLRILFETQFCKGIKVDYKEIQRAHLDVLEQTSIRNQKVTFYKNRIRKRFGFATRSKAPSTAILYLHAVAKHVIAFGQNNRESCSYWLNDMFELGISEKEITDQILNFIFAGYDTTASALSWSLYCLATNPNEQDKCRIEARSTDIRFSYLSSLSFIKKCVQESMRLYPPVWSIHRQSVAEDTISGIEYPAASYFMICAYTLQRDPDYWEDADNFQPERFAPENNRGNAFQYIPFGQGERVCIGQSLAVMEAQLILAKLLTAVSFSYSKRNAPKIVPGIIMKSVGGIRLDMQSL
jgi:cytochrome P450